MNKNTKKLQYIIEQTVRQILKEASDIPSKYTHVAVNKYTNLIVNGWDYSDEDPIDLRNFREDYFFVDLRDYGFNPKAYKILTTKMASKMGINQWSNTGAFSLEEENKMKEDGQNPFEIAMQEHPDWFIDN